MDARSIGRISRITDVEPAQLILFSMPSGSEVGMVVRLGQESKGVLHFEAKHDGIIIPTIYNIENFYNEIAVVIDSARVVPVLAPEHVGFGRYPGGFISQALYLTDKVAAIRARSGNNAVPVDLLTGVYCPISEYDCAYTKAWYIEVVDADGSYEPFFEVRCQQ